MRHYLPHDVTQADREAAAAMYGADEIGRSCALSGGFDETPIVQAFAAHRLAAIAADRRGRTFSPTEIDKAVAEERARVVAFLRTKGWAAVNKTFEPGADWIAAVIERGDHIQEK